MTRPEPHSVARVACVGTGTVGAGWAALFLARGLEVHASDPAPEAEARLLGDLERAWKKLERLGLDENAGPERLRFTLDLDEAVAGAEFVQESAPDDEALKIELIAAIDATCSPETVIASSSSRFLPSRLSARCAHPQRVIVGHPFVPSYLVPLVEVVGAEGTDPAVLDWAVEFYAAMGKRPLKLKKEIEAYVANRLQHAVFEEALRLVQAGVCDYDDVDTAVRYGPGLRWAFSGPMLHRHLGGGKGGVRHMIAHFGWPGAPGADEAFIAAIENRWGHRSIPELEDWRDENLLKMLEVIDMEP